MNDLTVDDEKLISTTRASELSGYSKDYVGQLCREEKLLCRRISGHWYVSEKSITQYQKRDSTEHALQDDAVSDDTATHGMKVGNVRDDTFSYDGIEYIATSRGAELTGYAQDYIGQLARNGEIEAQKVGRRWFVGRSALAEHKKHNDNLLAAVQARASGVDFKRGTEESEEVHVDVNNDSIPIEIDIHANVDPGDINFNVRYITETDYPLVPKMLPRVPVKNTYAPGDIDKVPFGQIGEKIPASQREVLHVKHAANTAKPQKSVSRTGVGIGSLKDSGMIFRPASKKQRTPRHIVVILIVILSLVGLTGYMYLFGPPRVISDINIESLVPSDLLRTLSDSYGDILPGSDFQYDAN